MENEDEKSMPIKRGWTKINKPTILIDRRIIDGSFIYTALKINNQRSIIRDKEDLENSSVLHKKKDLFETC